MARRKLILDRYELLGTAGTGGFGTVQIAWDPRIQRKVAIKTIQLTEQDAFRAGLQGAQAVNRAHKGETRMKRRIRSDEQGQIASGEASHGSAPDSRGSLSATKGASGGNAPGGALIGTSQDQESVWAERAVQGGRRPAGMAKGEPENQKRADTAAGAAEGSPVDDSQARGARAGNTKRGGLQYGASPAIDPQDGNPLAGNPLAASTADRWRGVLPWDEFLESEDAKGIDPNSIPEITLDQQRMRRDREQGDRSRAGRDGLGSDGAAMPHSSDPDGAAMPHGSGSNGAAMPHDSDSDKHSKAGSPVRRGQEDACDPDPDARDFDLDARNAARKTAQDSQMLSDDPESSELPSDAPVTALAHLPGLDEARTAAMLSDSRIVAVYDFEVRDQIAYLIMEYVEGITLSVLLDDYGDYLTLDMIACVFDTVAGALSAAHKAGVLHLDIKPDNIMINAEGQAKVTDFGLATLADASGAGTTGGGTIGYMPLEQMRREDLDARTDEWSLAAMTYEMLTGDNPFRARDLPGAERAILDAELVLPSLCWESLDPQIDDVLFFALDPDKDERYADISDFAEEVDKFLGDPERGKRQLALAVSDALHDGEDEGESAAGTEATGVAGGTAPEPGLRMVAPVAGASDLSQTRGYRFLSWLAGPDPNEESGRAGDKAESEAPPASEFEERFYAEVESDDESDDYGEYDDEFEDSRELRRELRRERRRMRRQERRPHEGLGSKFSSDVVASAGKVFGGVATGLLAWLSLMNIDFLVSLLGGGAPFATLAGAAAFGVVGAFSVELGVLMAYSLFGISLITCGNPVIGAAVIAITALWWYITGREGIANDNVALLTPLAGSIGGFAVVPMVGGVSLRPLQTVVTVTFSFFVACVFAALGSNSLVGWDAFLNWNYLHVDVMQNLMRLFSLPGTWASLAGWVAAAALSSVMNLRGKRWSLIVGVVLSAAAVLAGTLAFMGLPALSASVLQLIVSVGIATVVLIVAL